MNNRNVGLVDCLRLDNKTKNAVAQDFKVVPELPSLVINTILQIND